MTESNIQDAEIAAIAAESDLVYRGLCSALTGIQGGVVVSALMRVVIEVIEQAPPELQRVSCNFIRELLDKVSTPTSTDTVQ